MLSINTEKLIQSVLKKGMMQAHLNYTFTICKNSDIPSKLKNSVKKNASNFFDGGSAMQYIIFKAPEDKREPTDATARIAQMIKTNFLDGDVNNTFTVSEIQIGFIEKNSRNINEADVPEIEKNPQEKSDTPDNEVKKIKKPTKIEDDSEKSDIEEPEEDNEDKKEQPKEEEFKTNKRMFYLMKFKMDD